MDLYINTITGIVVEFLSEKPDGVTVRYSHLPSLVSYFGERDAKAKFNTTDIISLPAFRSTYDFYDGDDDNASRYTEGDL